MFRMSRIVPNQRSIRKSVTARLSRGGKIVALAAVLGCVLLAIYGAANLAKSSAKSGAPAVTVRAAGRGNRYLNFQDGRRSQVDYRGDETLTKALQSGEAQPRGLASADLDSNGTPDLIAGYAYKGMGIVTVQRGNPDAFAPKDDSIFTRVQQGYQPPSLLSKTETYTVPEPVDFLVIGDFTGTGHKDVLTAARGGGGLYLLTDAPDGTLGSPERINVWGQVTALAAGEFGSTEGKASVVVGVLRQDGPAVLAYTGATGGLQSAPEVYPLRSSAVSLSLGRMDDDRFGDALVVTTGELDVIHGGGEKTSNSGQSRVEPLDPGFKVQAATLGDFVKDRDFKLEIALLADDGSLHVLQRNDLDTRSYTPEEQRYRASHRIVLADQDKSKQEAIAEWSLEAKLSWTPAAKLESDISAARVSPQSLLLTAHISPFDTEDILALDGAGNQVRVFADTPATQDAALSDFVAPLQRVALSLDVESAPVAVVALPRKINGTHDVVVLNSGQSAPSFVPILPTATFTVNTTADHADGTCGVDCSLRDAVAAANAAAGSTIQFTAGSNTYQLTINGNAEVGNCGNNAIGDLDVDPTVTIMGNGSGSTIIQQTILGDRIFCLDQNVSGNRTYMLSGLTMTGGRETHSVGGGGVVSGAIGDSTTFTDCVISNSRADNSGTAGGTSPVGGGFGQANGSLSLSGTTVGGTTTVASCASQTTVSCGNSATGSGGGIYQQGSNPPAITFMVTASANGPSIFQNNVTGNGGGAINVAATGTASYSTITISGSTFTSNQATSSTSRGGAIRNESVGAATTMNISTCTFLSNTVTGASANGGAVASADGANHNVNISFSRLVGNTSPNNLNGGQAIFGGTSSTMTINNNWWGVNTGPDTTCTGSCDAAGTFTETVHLQLRNLISGVNVHNGNQIAPSSSATFSADILGLSTGGSTSSANLTGIALFPSPAATVYDNAVLGTVPANSFQYTAGVAPSITYTAGAVKGTGSVRATADNQQITTNVIIGFTPEWVNPSGDDNVANAFASAACGAGNTPCFKTIGAGNTSGGLFNIAVAGTMHIQTGTYSESPNFDQNCTTLIDGNITVNALTLTNGTYNAQSATTTLASGNFTNNGGTFTAGSSTINFTPGSGAQSIGGTQQTTFNNLTINNASGASLTNSETVGGTLTLTNGTLGVGTNTLTLNGAVSFASGSFTSAATGTVNYNQGSAGQGVAPGSYGNLTFSNFNKTLASTGTIGVAGTFTPGSAVGHTITGSTFDFNGAGAQTVPVFNYNNLTISGNRGGGAITLASGNVGVAGSFSPTATNNTYTTTGNTVVFNGSALQSVPAFSFNGLTLNNAAGANLAGDVTVNAGLTLTSGALGVGTNTLTLNGAVSTGGGTLTSSATGTVNYNQGSNGQATVLAANYGNLTFSNFSKTLASSGTIGIAGTFTPGTGTGHTITGSTIDFNGAGAQSVPGFTYNSLTVSGSGRAITLDSSNTIKIAGAFTPGANTYTITGSTIEYNGTSAQSLPSSNFNTYNNLTLNNAAGTTGFAGLTVNGLIEVKAGTFTSSSTYNNVQIDSGATLAATAASTINVSGSWTNNGGTFTASTSTVNFNGSSLQTIGGTGNTTFNNLTNSNAAGISMTNDNTVSGVLALTSGDITVANTKTLSQSSATASTGTFDVIGSVKRTNTSTLNTNYTFGNPNNQITTTAGTPPTDITVNLVKAAPAGFSTAVLRTYTITPTGGSGITATLRLHYQDADLNGNTEGAGLLLRRFNGTGWAPYSPTAFDTTNNWVENNVVHNFSPWTFSSCCSPTAGNATVSGRITTSDGTPLAGTVINMSGGQGRKTITDANGNYRFENVATDSFYTVTPALVNFHFSPANRSFSLVANKSDAIFTAEADATQSANPLDTAEYFVRQQYVDILGREPDEGGFNYWSNEINACGSDRACANARRRDVAAAFFVEQEFQQTGSFLYDVYAGALGRKPVLVEYSADRQQVVGGANLDVEKSAFAQSFVQRAEFAERYQANTSAESFVDALIASVRSSGVDLSGERANLINSYNSGASMVASRAAVLRGIADNAAFKQSQYNGAFVLTEYFGYLRRDPDQGGYDFWLNVLNNREPENFRGMVCAFITSTEYQKRFSVVVSHSNGECGQ
jgi:CSLREA domain-containing protein